MRKRLAEITDKSAHEVILHFNDHWIVIVRPVLGYLIGWGIFLFLWFSANVLSEASQDLSTILRLFDFALLYFLHHRLMIRLVDWEVSSWVITTELVIDFEDTLYLKNDVIFINISEIHEIEKKKHGFLSNFLDYGDVHINVPAAPYPIICRYIPHPDQFVNLIEGIRDHRLEEELDIKVLKNIYGRKFRFALKERAKKK